MPVTASALKEKATSLYTTRSGNEFKIRRLSRGEIVAIWKGIPDVSGMEKIANTPIEEINEDDITPEQAENLIARMEAIVKCGLVDPSIGDGEDQIQLYDLEPLEVSELAMAIWNKTKARADVVRP